MKYKIHDIVFARHEDVIIIREAYYDKERGTNRYEGVVPETGASRHYDEWECLDSVDEYEKELLDGVKNTIKARKEEMEKAALILEEELKKK